MLVFKEALLVFYKLHSFEHSCLRNNIRNRTHICFVSLFSSNIHT